MDMSKLDKQLRELGLIRYSNDDLKSFTSDFLDSNKIGFGACGVVYRGQLTEGTLIAVKVLKNMDSVENTFMAEVSTMGNARHDNLVKLYGYCFEDNMKALVYEYMEYGSLDKILYENHHSSIEWVKLYGIAIDVAKGLNHLHNGLEERIIHYDIKAANVLLDKNYSAKITDFGLAKIMNRDVSGATLTTIRGTRGYNAPETWMLGSSHVTFKCDVYSFGMLLFEVLGKINNGKDEEWFPKIVWKHYISGNLEQLITDCGITEKDKDKANILSKVALWCILKKPEGRPSMEKVVSMLENKETVLDPPKKESEYDQAQGMTYASITGGGNNGSEDGSRVPLHQLDEDLAMTIPTTELVGKKTALKNKELILQWIAKDEVVAIGVHGMGGIGKTTIFKHVYNQLLAKRDHLLIWVTVSKDGNITKLQDDLAKELGLSLSSEDDTLRRSKVLLHALRSRKRVLYFLDDMWKRICLEEIGIPKPTQENGCKLLLTTRSLDVCNRMGCKNNVLIVKPLLEDEALELFMNKVDLVLTPKVREIAELVAKKCGGLPLALITVGAAMRGNDDFDEWNVALRQLKESSNANPLMDFNDDIVFEQLKFSYDRLPNEILKKCFLYCALYSEIYKIPSMELIDFWIMEGIVEGRKRHDELISEGRYLLKKLKDHCLLESVDDDDDEMDDEMADRVTMHDLIKEMALGVTSKCFMVKSDVEELPNEEEWGKDLERTSFMFNYIREVSISPNCPNLTTLFLRISPFLRSITPSFFVHMQCLRVLDLGGHHMVSNSQLEMLPDSISDLVKLRALRLSWCVKLKKLPSLAKLKSLRTLELDFTAIEELPKGMEMLVNLRCLNLNAVKLKKRIPKGLISKLSALQELYLGGIHVDKLYNPLGGECFINELLSLNELENLSVCFRCMSDYENYVRSSKFNGLKYFFLTIRRRWGVFINQHHLGEPPRATIQLCYSPDEASVQNPPIFPGNTKQVIILKFHVFTRLSELGWLIKDVKMLVGFHIFECENIECIWSSEDDDDASWLHPLKKIEIVYCPKLYILFKGIPTPPRVYCLKKLRIGFCHSLKIMFSTSVLQLLQNLESIFVCDCNELEELIERDDEEGGETPIIIPRLKELLIICLPKLKCIWRGLMICDSLKKVEVENSFKLKKLPQFKGNDQSIPPPDLWCIEGSKQWWDSLEWDPVYPQNILQPFFIENSSTSEGHMNYQSNGVEKFWSEEAEDVHIGNVCDNCKMNLKFRKLYICKDCLKGKEDIRFQLCEECYNTPSKHSDIVNQHLTLGHTFELLVPPTLKTINKEIKSLGLRMLYLTDALQKQGNLHFTTTCDNCEMFPIARKRYRCKDCWEERVVHTQGGTGFDLCEECYNTPSKHSDAVHQHLTLGHTFELIVPPILKEIKILMVDLVYWKLCLTDILQGGNQHIGIACDKCEMNPIVRKGYRCKDCWEEGTGFNLCEECYNINSKHSDVVNLHLTQGHTFELLVTPTLKTIKTMIARMDFLNVYLLNALHVEGNLHIEIRCDNCEMDPIVGKGYRCKDCWVVSKGVTSFNLCEECCYTPSNHSDVVIQHFTQGHIFELIVPPSPDEIKKMRGSLASNILYLMDALQEEIDESSRSEECALKSEERGESSQSNQCALERKGNLNSQSDRSGILMIEGEGSLMPEGEDSLKSNECAPEEVEISESFQSEINVTQLNGEESSYNGIGCCSCLKILKRYVYGCDEIEEFIKEEEE